MKRESDAIEQIFKKQGAEGEKVALSQLRNKRHRQPQLNDQVYSRIERLRRYALNDSSIPTEKLNTYFCSLCGRVSLISNILLDNLPKRRTDNSTSVELRGNFIKLSLQRDRLKHIKREQGIELQYRWKCECGISIGYTCISYDQFQQLRNDQKTRVTNRTYFYLYQGAVVQKMKQSKLISELITYKETILLHLKKKPTKK